MPMSEMNGRCECECCVKTDTSVVLDCGSITHPGECDLAGDPESMISPPCMWLC